MASSHQNPARRPCPNRKENTSMDAPSSLDLPSKLLTHPRHLTEHFENLYAVYRQFHSIFCTVSFKTIGLHMDKENTRVTPQYGS